MEIILNGEKADARDGETLGALIARLGVGGAVAAQVNDEVIHRDRQPAVKLNPGDRVELFRMMGGG
ncbi:MAG: sulfur carrier protein ThiS [Nitrospinae bacterium]|nr:sulfur carrier protein ThiS [Nitrospinota bacterium]